MSKEKIKLNEEQVKAIAKEIATQQIRIKILEEKVEAILDTMKSQAENFENIIKNLKDIFFQKLGYEP